MNHSKLGLPTWCAVAILIALAYGSTAHGSTAHGSTAHGAMAHGAMAFGTMSQRSMTEDLLPLRLRPMSSMLRDRGSSPALRNGWIKGVRPRSIGPLLSRMRRSDNSVLSKLLLLVILTAGITYRARETPGAERSVTPRDRCQVCEYQLLPSQERCPECGTRRAAMDRPASEPDDVATSPA